MSAVLFGSISTIIDTSELQRASFNEAFEEHGLDWVWGRDDYVARLEQSGGAQRIADYAASLGQSVDADAVHRTKSSVFQDDLATAGLAVRDGVAETIKTAKEQGFKVALVTTTSAENVAALLKGVAPEIDPGMFDLVVDASQVSAPKPDKAAYVYALERLGEDAGSCVAIEDNVGGVHSAVSAGVPCVAFPNENTAGHAFDEADSVVRRIDFDALRRFTTGETRP